MNDPHVETLIYRLRHDDNCDYNNAPSIEFDYHPSFKINIEKPDPENSESGIFVHFEMKDHIATEDEARAVCDPFIEAWELKVLLEFGPQQFWLEFNQSEIIDRKPTPGTLTAVGASLSLSFAIAKAHIGRDSYPTPPQTYTVDDPVRNMALHYLRFKQEREPLGPMAAFCLTAIEGAAGKRGAASKVYAVSLKVLNRLGQMTDEAGGEHARKYKGASRDFTQKERKWLIELIPKLIARAAEVAHDPEVERTQITMGDLPNLTTNSAK